MSYSRTTNTSKSNVLFLILIVLFTVFNFGILCKNWSDYNLSNRVGNIEQNLQQQNQINAEMTNNFKVVKGVFEEKGLIPKK